MRLPQLSVLATFVCSLMLSGCGDSAGPDPTTTFTEFKTAMSNGDWKSGFLLMTPKTQDGLLGPIVSQLTSLKAFAPASETAGLDELIAKHKINAEAKPDAILQGIPDKGACFQDIVDFMKAKMGGNQSNPFATEKMLAATLTDVKIDGNSATGKIDTDTLYFELIDGKWLIDFTRQVPTPRAPAFPDQGQRGRADRSLHSLVAIMAHGSVA